MYFSLEIKLAILLVCTVINYSQGKKIKLKYRKQMELEEKAQAKLAAEKPEDVSEGDEFKKRNLVELDETMAKILFNPVRGQAETLIKSISRYTHALHRYIKKTKDGDQETIELGKAYIKRGVPASFKIKVSGKHVNKRVGFDKYEFQHYEYCREESVKSWNELKELLENLPTNSTTTSKPVSTTAK